MGCGIEEGGGDGWRGTACASRAVNPVRRVIDVEVGDESLHERAADPYQFLGGPKVPRFLDVQHIQRICG